jgi:hypothetical protein
VAVDRHSLALATLRTGRPREALDMLCGLFGKPRLDRPLILPLLAGATSGVLQQIAVCHPHSRGTVAFRAELKMRL